MKILKKFLSRTERAGEARKQELQKESTLIQAMDRVVTTIAPAICSLRECRRQLRSPVENALVYLQNTIDTIPGPLPLSPQAWDQHPLLQALFTDAGEIRTLLWADRRLRSFFTRHPASQACALLTATRRERTIFGTAVEGEIVRRDVAQTAVDFRDHRLLDPAATLAETRHELQMRALTALVTPVVERALRMRSLQDELREQQRILSVQLKIRRTRPDLCGRQSPEEAENGSSGNGTPRILEDIDREIRELSAATSPPEEVMRQVAEVLTTPQAALTVTPVAMRLNWMGVKQCRSSSDCDLDVRLIEVELKDHWRRTAVFVSIDRDDASRPLI